MAAAIMGEQCDSTVTTVTSIEHYQRRIKSNIDNDAKLLYCLQKLYKLDIKVPHLQVTGVGRTVNGLRKRDGEVGSAARQLVSKWMQIVENHNSSSEDEATESNGHINGETVREQISEYDKSENTSENVHRQDRSPEKKYRHRDNVSNEVSQRRLENFTKEHPRKHNDKASHGEGSQRHKDKESDSHRHRSKNASEEVSHRSSSYESNSRDKHRRQESSLHRRDTSSHREKDKPSDSSKKHFDSSHKDSSKSRQKDETSSERKNESSRSSSKDKKDYRSDGHKHKSSSKKEKEKSHSIKAEKSSHKSHSFEDAILSTTKHKSSDSSHRKVCLVKPLMKIKEEKIDEIDEDYQPIDLPVPRFIKEGGKKIKTEPYNYDEPSSSYNGHDSSVGDSFEAALGLIDSTSPKKSKKDKKKNKNSTKSTSTSSSNTKPLPKSEELAAILDLPAINPNYRPLPQVPLRQQQRTMVEVDPLTSFMSNKTQRTKVYSGVKAFHGEVPSLQDMCIKILQDNLDAIEDIGWAPFYLMEPVLSRASASQLAAIEYHNPQIMEDTDKLWHTLVQSEFRGAERLDEDEEWRDVYKRSENQREEKLTLLRDRIKKNNEARMAPQRTTKLAYVNTHAKPPRTVRAQQMKHGTSRGSLPPPPIRSAPSPSEQPGPSGSQPALSSHASTIARTLGVLRDGPSMSIPSRKRPAPLMQKTLKFMKTNYKR